MRTLSNCDEQLNFGKHRGKTVKDVHKEDPSYVEWLYQEDVIQFTDKESQKWFEKKARPRETQVSYTQYYAAHVAAGFFSDGYYDHRPRRLSDGDRAMHDAICECAFGS
jgi:hypothetical protein